MRKIKTSKIEKKNYHWYLLSYLLFTLFLLLLFSVAYYGTMTRVKRNQLEESLVALQRGCDIIDEEFLRVYSALDSITKHSDFRAINYISTPLSSQDYYTLLEGQNLMRATSLQSKLIRDCMIVYDDGGVFMLSPDIITHDFEEYSNFSLFVFGQNNYNEFMSLLDQNKNNIYNINSFVSETSAYWGKTGRHNVVSYVFSIQSPRYNASTTSIIFLDTSYIKKLLIPFVDEADFSLCMTDRTGNYLIRTDENITALDGGLTQKTKRDTRLAVTSETTGLSYTVSIPNAWTSKQLLYFSILFKFLVAASVIIGLTLSLILTRQSLKPLYALTSLNRNMTDTISEWKPLIVSTLIDRLMNDGLNNSEELNVLPGFYESLPGRCQTLALGIACYDEQLRYSFTEESIGKLRKLFDERFEGCLLYRDSDRIAAVVIDMDAFEAVWQKDGVNTSLNELLSEILNELNTDPCVLHSIGIGCETTDIRKLHISFGQAKKALAEAKLWHNSQIVRYDAIRNRKRGYDVPYERLEKLYNILMLGDGESASRFLEDCYTSFKTGNVSGDGLSQFIYEVRGVILRLANKYPLESIVNQLYELNEKTDCELLAAEYKKAVIKTAEILKNQKEMVAGRLLEGLMEYINKNYMDASISLKTLAVEFSMSDKYISFFFKDKSGYNFSDYLENLRLTKAIELMREQSIPISKLHGLVGYTTANTFYKAFKRKYGTSPSNWRDAQEDESGNEI